MNRSFQFHPLSALVGLVLGAVCLVSMSLTVVPTPLRVEYLAHPRDFVQVREGTPYTVPSGKVFVLTGLGGVTNANQCSLYVNGSLEVYTSNFTGCAPEEISIREVPPGLKIGSGNVLTVSSPSGASDGRAWGYLAAEG